MSKFRFLLLSLFISLIFIEPLAFSGVTEPAKKVLKVGTTPDYPPLIFKKDGVYSGIEAELAAMLSRELGLEIVFIDMPMSEIFSSLESGKVDMIMSGISVTRERKKQVRFLFPFMTINQMAVVRKEMENGFASAESIYDTSLKVGYGKGTTGELLVKENMKKAKGIAFNSPNSGLEALEKKEIDLFIYDSPYIWNLFNEKKEKELSGLFWPLTEEDIAWAVSLKNEKLAETINDLVIKWKRNGTTTKIMNKWIRIKRTFVAYGEVS